MKILRKIRRPVYLAFFCLFGVVLTACNPAGGDKYHWQFSGNTMGTTYHIKAIGHSHVELPKDELALEIDKALVSFNQVMSTYIADSELSLFNKHAVKEWVSVTPNLMSVLLLAQQVSVASNGAFDITVGPLVNAWGFGPVKREGMPSDEEIAKAMEVVGYHNLELDKAGLRIFKEKAIYVDLSAIAKGFATDVIAELLEVQGIHNYMVEIGGELKIRGHNFSEKPWAIGVEKPALGHTGTMQKISGDNVGIATSGDYRNFYEVEGKRVSHTLDPNTGKPIDHALASVTVITQTGGAADAYATAINVLGPDLGYDLAIEQNLAVFLVVREADGFTTKHTPQFEQYMVD
ncbi:FAD:protein FMN transferase [Thalassocella blandensis]|nr:FAD:protein FMN transferase [Thalassocella blandensis]